jgi:hypothetical protein
VTAPRLAIDPPPPGVRIDLVAEPAVADAGTATTQAVRAHLARLTEAQLIDAHDTELAGAPGTRVLLHHVGPEGAACLEEWRVVLDGYLVTLSASCPALDYDALADAHAAAAASLRVEP